MADSTPAQPAPLAATPFVWKGWSRGLLVDHAKFATTEAAALRSARARRAGANRTGRRHLTKDRVADDMKVLKDEEPHFA